MSIFFNRYTETEANVEFSALVPQSNEAISYAVGQLGSEGLLSFATSQGHMLWSTSYAITGETVTFIKGVQAPNGDILMFGTTQKQGTKALVVRTSSTGTLIWSKIYDQGTQDEYIDFIEIGDDNYVFLTRYSSEDVEGLELVKIDNNGRVVTDYQLWNESYNVRPHGLEHCDAGFLVYGGTDTNGNWDSFFIIMNDSLVVQNSEYVGNSRYQVARSVVHKEGNKFIVAGDHDLGRDTFLIDYRTGYSSISAEIYDISHNQSDEGYKDIEQLSTSPDEFMLVNQPNSNSPAMFTTFNASLVATDHKNVSSAIRFEIKDLFLSATGTEKVRCVGVHGNSGDGGLLLRTNDVVDLCCSTDEATPTKSTKTYTVSEWTIEGSSPRRRESNVTVTTSAETLIRDEQCGGFIDLSGEYMSQSPFVYMQAAGSDGVDGTVKGFHLRYDFRKVLGKRHFAKGNLSGQYGTYPATYGFNQMDDFIKGYRTAFTENYYTVLDLTAQPNIYKTSGSVREWVYEGLTPTGVTGGTSADAVVSFPDTAAYDAQAASTPPSGSTSNFLKNYSGEVHVRLGDKLCFRAKWSLGYVNSGDLSDAVLRYETVSLTDSTDATSEYLSKRTKLIEADFPSEPITICEDIKTIRFDRVNTYPTRIDLYAYEDYLLGTNQNDAWTKLGEYSLTESQTEAYDRLEDTASFNIDKKWPKYNEDDQATGKAKVNVANYEDRWSKTNGLAAGVNKYLDLSQSSSNETATETIASEAIGNLQDNSSIELSYFKMLGISSFDFHVARMLGMGTLDPMSTAGVNDQYIYLMEYNTIGDLEDGQGARAVKHLYMTPHLDIMDFKNAPMPILENPITYGVAVNNGTSNPSTLTDADGYTAFADMRMVNLSRQPFQFEKPFETFFQNTNSFCLSDEGLLAGFGVEYAKQGNPNVYPELNNDNNYNDDNGVAETNIILNTGNNPVYRHQETEEGIHCYAMYSVNWFSRASDTGVSVCTDETIFPVRNTIVPPANLAAHLIQPESPLMLTTSAEQTMYDDLIGDKTLVRTSFDWNFVQNQQYQFADKVEFFFNEREKINSRGEITGITQLSGHRLELTTGPYTITSVSPAEVVTPTIDPLYDSNFKGSLLAINGLNYRVEEVIQTGGGGVNPKLIVHQIKETNSIESSAGSNVWTTTESYVSPSVGDRFFISENLGPGSHWYNKLQKSVYLEKFSNNDSLAIASSTNNDGDYSIDTVTLNGANTDIVVNESIIDSVTDGNVVIDQLHVSVGFNGTNNGFLIDGNHAATFNAAGTLRVFGSIDNDGDHTISTATNVGGQTNIVLSTAPNLTSFVGYIAIDETFAVTGYDSATKTITVAGDQTVKIKPTYSEIRQNTDGTTTKLFMGGMVADCAIVEELDVYNDIQEDNGLGTAGNTIPGSRTGVYTMTFTGNPLPPHIDPDVSWFKGKVRVMEDSSFLPTPLDTRTTAKMKELDVMNVYEDENTGDLILSVQDPTFQIEVDYTATPDYTPAGEYVPILTGTQTVNYHPSYHLYLHADETNGNEFNEQTTLPGFGEGSVRTFLGIRAVDSVENDPVLDNCASHIITPVALLAQEIREPQQPDEPSGPLYATRPDFYGKSTYTIDVGFPNTPYSVLVYKANYRKVLDQLYTAETANWIEEQLAALGTDPDFTDRWNGLVNMEVEPSGADINKFKAYGGFRFPNPNNSEYQIPQSVTAGIIEKPFEDPGALLLFIDDEGFNVYEGAVAPGDATAAMFTQDDQYGNEIYSFSMAEVVKEAIESAFVSQTEEPMIYEHLKDGIEQTSSAKPKFRNANGDRLKPTDAEYNAHPNAIKLTNGDLRFTDYNIDGGAQGFYFYYAMEYSDRQKKSDASTIIGPIQVVNTRPAKQPSIKSFVTQIENAANNIPTGVSFKLQEYIESEGIVRVDIYRAIDPLDALTIRTMDLAAQINITTTIADAEIIDVFEGLDYPLYGEDLYYRVVAMRKVTLEDGATEEYIPSEPSKLIKTTIVDPINPIAPCIVSENGTTTATELQDVILKWDQACYNGTYSLQKMNSAGNWVEFYSIKSNDDTMQYPPLDGGGLPDWTNYPETDVLDREDADGNPIYHRFRVQVENSSGLFNLSDCPRVLATGDFDLDVLSEYVSYSDQYGFSLDEITSQEVDDGTNNHPKKMKFTASIPSPLPAGHNSFTELEITVTDDQGNTFTKTITTSTGTAIFSDGEGGLLLNDPNHSYTIVTKLTTDLATNGFKQKAVLNYVHGPCNDLSNLAQVLTVTDNTHTYDVDTSNVSVNDSSADSPVSLQFTDVSDVANLTNPQTFTSLEITVTDDLGNSDTKTISSAGGSVTFNDGDGGLELNDGDANRGYNVSATLITSQCTAGHVYNHDITYIYDPYAELNSLTDIVSFLDNITSINPLTSQNVDDGVHNPGGVIKITDILGANLPSNHTFTKFEVDIHDGQGGFHTQSSTNDGVQLTFSTGQGNVGEELDLGATNPNPTISITYRIYTDLCPNGASFYYSMYYTYDPYEDLASQTAIASFTDNNSTAIVVNPLYVQDVNGDYLKFSNEILPDPNDPNDPGTPGDVNPNGSITIASVLTGNLPAGDTFDHMNVNIKGVVGDHTLTISSIAGSVTFFHGDGGLEFNGGGIPLDLEKYERQMLTISLTVYTTLCPDGVTFIYNGRYTSGT